LVDSELNRTADSLSINMNLGGDAIPNAIDPSAAYGYSYTYPTRISFDLYKPFRVISNWFRGN